MRTSFPNCVGWVGSIVGLVAVAIGAIGLVTGATGRCPTYVLLGVSTLPEAKATPVQPSIG